MPRGVAIPEVREQLFAATDRVLARAGPSGLTTRAITAEAGVANGVLHKHFRDLDAFLAEFAATRLAALAGTAASLPARPGQGSTAATPPAPARARRAPAAAAGITLPAARGAPAPAVAHAAPPAGGGGIGDVESHFAAYLDAEKQAGRIAAGTDTQALAFTLIGAIHHLVITSPGGVPDLAQRARRIVAALPAGAGPGPR